MYVCMHVVSSLSCVQCFTDPVDCSLPGSSVHGISLARILEWAAISFSKGSSQPRDQIHHLLHLLGRFFTTEPPRYFIYLSIYLCSV